LTTKLHVAVAALSNPVRGILTADQIADVKQAEALIKDQPDEFVVAHCARQPTAYPAAFPSAYTPSVRSAHLQELPAPARNWLTAAGYILDATHSPEEKENLHIFRSLRLLSILCS